MIKTKLNTLKELMAAGEHRAALKLAASWHDLGAHKKAITRGWAAISNPAFYRQLGQEPKELAAAGVQAIRERYKLS